MLKHTNNHGLTMAELLVAASISIIAVGVAFTLWFMAQGAWVNERTKSSLLQDLQVAIERIKREIQMSDGGKIVFHTAADGTYDAVSLSLALDDGRGSAGYSPSQEGDGFIEADLSTLDPITGIARIFWDQTVIYHLYQNGDKWELRRTLFYPRDNSLTSAQRQQQTDRVVSLGTGNDATVPEFQSWKSTRTILKAKYVSFEALPQLREFDGYNVVTSKTEDMVDFGSIILSDGYHTIKFKATNKNTASSGYGFGIDALKFTPSGGIQEGEYYSYITYPDGSSGISGSSGDALSTINMHNSPYGVWSNDYYLNYASDAVNDSLTLRFYYDTWNETTFLDGISNNIKSEFSNRNGRKGETSGSEEYMLRLEGYDTTWNSYKQARQGSYTLPAGHEPAGDKTYRIIVSTKYLQYNGMMARIKFRAHDSQPLTIRSAYIVQQNTDAGADPYDGSTQMQYKAITFDGGGTAATIPANEAKWSDWIQMEDVGPVPAPLPLDKASSYLITFYVPNADEIVYWENANIGDDPMSYVRSGETAAGEVNWPVGINGEQRIYAVEEMFVSYVKEGAYSSQIFDTAVEDPVFTKMQYTAITNSDSSLNLKVRSGDNKASLEADSDWADITGISLVGNPGDISAVSGGRYVQFKAGFSAVSGGVTAESYDNSCVLKDVSIYWPGNTTMVDIGGYFTKQPDYGIFTIEVDGQKLTKGFEIKLSVGDDTVTGAAVNRSVTAEVEPRNTGK